MACCVQVLVERGSTAPPVLAPASNVARQQQPPPAQIVPGSDPNFTAKLRTDCSSQSFFFFLSFWFVNFFEMAGFSLRDWDLDLFSSEIRCGWINWSRSDVRGRDIGRAEAIHLLGWGLRLV